MTFWKTTEYLQLFSRIYTLFIDRLVSRSSDEVKDSIVTKRSPFRINNDLNTDAGIQLINKMPEIPQSHSDSVSRSSFASMEIYISFFIGFCNGQIGTCRGSSLSPFQVPTLSNFSM